jgi:hypothetical protein
MARIRAEDLKPPECTQHLKTKMVYGWGSWSGELLWRCPIDGCRSMLIYESERRDRKPWTPR